VGSFSLHGDSRISGYAAESHADNHQGSGQNKSSEKQIQFAAFIL
jgi:hypothetical protein